MAGESREFSQFSDGTNTYTIKDSIARSELANKQDALVSGTNIKTINNQSILGEGNLTVDGSVSIDEETITQNTDNELQVEGIKNKRDDNTLSIWQGTEYQWNHGALTTWYCWQTNVQAQWIDGGTTLSSNSVRSLQFVNGKFFIELESTSDKIIYSDDNGETWNSATLPTSGNWHIPVYANGNFIVEERAYSNKVFYSNDNFETWNATTLPSKWTWGIPVYGNGTLVVLQSDSVNDVDATAYSTDNGETWVTGGTLPVGGYWGTPVYGNGVFVTIKNDSDVAAYSDDNGTTWNRATLPSSGSWRTPVYGNGVFVTVNYNSNVAAYSDDNGTTWNRATLPSSGSWLTPVYGNGIFITTKSNTTAYSTDNGETWVTGGTLPNSGTWYLVYGDGIFVATQWSSSNRAAYSMDNGITWQSTTLPTSGSWKKSAYGNGVFVTAKGYDSAIFDVQYDKCYTDIANPTLSSIVYSAPETMSDYTITSITNNEIILTNNKTYHYSSSGNQNTYRTIGDAHPDWLCNINSVGVKIGNTIVATAGGSGSSYTAGDGIDITNDTISIDNTVATTSSLATVATSGSYNDLDNKPTIPDTTNMQTTTNLVTSVSSSSTDSQYPSAKLFYDTVGDIETLINAL